YASAQELAEALAPLAASDSSQLMLLPSDSPSRSPSQPLPAPAGDTWVTAEQMPTVTGDRPSQKLYRARKSAEEDPAARDPGAPPAAARHRRQTRGRQIALGMTGVAVVGAGLS